MNTIQLHDNWMTRARCADTDPAHFFPSDGVGVELAKKTCAGCPVTEQCLEYALTNRVEHGVWGGCSERQRRRIRRQRREVAATAA
ncbi:MAG: WhiB family transcriptional regulator [Acidimicrobiales bacterium]|jgi:WhiB family redox-sensing transcriptional regulator|nr:WhiB family transcriptional regulator [Acidimicrobiales bacterium]MDP6696661.1 WhiB family transcriptional regulator [Acidimicrobiales bacterium]